MKYTSFLEEHDHEYESAKQEVTFLEVSLLKRTVRMCQLLLLSLAVAWMIFFQPVHHDDMRAL